jgi:hypothetical protein
MLIFITTSSDRRKRNGILHVFRLLEYLKKIKNTELVVRRKKKDFN